jgi:DNA invertase Pin-like site-specific DNA recombinase
MTKSVRRVLRCAIYTRKSSEEGLDREFNSLEAQHEACAAYIKSQGWKAVAERFDDGGHSGGTLERPAMQRLLQLVDARQIDVIVIYKIDRLTRSLADFARLADSLDGNGVSFVSVTQQFNTTTSMGRLTLNMLLSFAQFEREVTGERSLITGKGPATSELRRIPAPEIEGAVRDAMLDLLAAPNRVLEAVGDRAGTETETVNRIVKEAAKRKEQLSSGTIREAMSATRPCLAGVIVESDKLQLEINQAAFSRWLTERSADPAPESQKGDAVFTYEITARLRMRGSQMKLVLDDASQAGRGTPDQVLVSLIVLAHELRQQLLSGTETSIQELADRHELPRSYASRMLRLGFLSPDITAAILEGTHPPDLTAETLRRLDRLPVDWGDQRRILGFQRL